MVGPGVEIRGAARAYALGGGRTVRALNSITLSVAPGSCCVLMGANGSGKTTLLRAIDGSVSLDAGEVSLLPVSGTGAHPSRVVHVSQDPAARTFGKLTLAEHFMLAEIEGMRAGWFGMGITRRRLARYGAFLEAHQRADLIPFLSRPIAELSGGMRQAVSILLAVIPSTSSSGEVSLLLLLDEPTGALDATNERRCLELIHRLHSSGATVMLVTHSARIAVEHADNIVLLHAGSVAQQVEVAKDRSLAFEGLATELRRLLALDVGNSPDQSCGVLRVPP